MYKCPSNIRVAGAWTFAVLSVVGGAILLAQERPRPAPPAGNTKPAEKAQADADRPPPGDTLFVWPIPEQGTQSLVVLRVVDGETVEAGLLVPVMVKIRGVKAPKPDSPEGKAAAEALDKLVGGRLLPANLHGRETYGRLVASFWLGQPDPKDPKKESGWLEEWLVKQGVVKSEDR